MGSYDGYLLVCLMVISLTPHSLSELNWIVFSYSVLQTRRTAEAATILAVTFIPPLAFSTQLCSPVLGPVLIIKKFLLLPDGLANSCLLDVPGRRIQGLDLTLDAA